MIRAERQGGTKAEDLALSDSEADVIKGRPWSSARVGTRMCSGQLPGD